ncbi:hypothetical protein CMO94_02485 [Candidatus Woesearchaeota archaeon]|jgi:uncharacterized membrane protein YqiK|nr:hypothetical protein [Candidatus Woesearchaeota archaeon]|tara:strand:- start:606 stop:860 length:255 start_codon:yes stop_codon:yes gene_type:complete
MNKKSQGMSVNVIIIAAIALIVLVVLVAIFTGRLGVFTKGVKGATNCNDICIAAGYTSGDKTDEGDPTTAGLKDSDNNRCFCEP